MVNGIMYYLYNLTINGGRKNKGVKNRAVYFYAKGFGG